MRRYIIPVTTASDGSATAYSAGISGLLHSIHYIKTDFADGVDFTITVDRTGEGVWTESNVNAQTVRYPRAPAHSQVGASLLYASGGTAVTDRIALQGDKIKVVIAAGGNAKSGAFHVLVDN